MTAYDEALARYRKIGASKADEPALMAAFCAYDIQRLVGAVSPRLVWEGAQKKGLTTIQLAKMAPLAVSDLMWV